MRAATSLDSVHTLAMNAELLCVRCRACKARRVIGSSDKLRITTGIMTPIHSLRLRCNACGGRDVERLIPLTREEADAWAATKEA